MSEIFGIKLKIQTIYKLKSILLSAFSYAKKYIKNFFEFKTYLFSIIKSFLNIKNTCDDFLLKHF